MVELLQQASAQVVLCTPALIGESKLNKQDGLLDQYAALVKEVAAERDTQLVDLRSIFRNYLAEHNSKDSDRGILTFDGVHFTDQGDRIVASEILKVLEPDLEPSKTNEPSTNNEASAAKDATTAKDSGAAKEPSTDKDSSTAKELILAK